MDEEKTAVLRMVAEKKITAEEGERLLEALEGSARPRQTFTDSRPSQPAESQREDQIEEEIKKAEEEIKKAEDELRTSEGDRIGHEVQERIRERMERLRQRLEEKRRRWEERQRERQRRHEEHQRRREERGRRHGFHVHIPPIPPIPPMPDVGKIVSDAIKSVNIGATLSGAMKGTFVGTLAQEEQEISVPEGLRRLMVMSSGGGDLTLRGTDEATLKVQGRCSVATYGEEARIDERGGNDVSLGVPASIRSIRVQNVGGGDIECHLIRLDGHEIDLSAPGGGDITLRVPEDAAFEIAMEARGGGDIHTDLPIETTEQTASSVKGRRNGGENSRVKLSAPGGGDIKLTRL